MIFRALNLPQTERHVSKTKSRGKRRHGRYGSERDLSPIGNTSVTRFVLVNIWPVSYGSVPQRPDVPSTTSCLRSEMEAHERKSCLYDHR
jgi:hypothetical protein